MHLESMNLLKQRYPNAHNKCMSLCGGALHYGRQIKIDQRVKLVEYTKKLGEGDQHQNVAQASGSLKECHLLAGWDKRFYLVGT